MKRVFLASIGALALAGLVGPAAAADLYRRYDPVPKAPVYAPLYNWTGLYLGLSGGGGWGRSRWDSTGDFDLSGGIIGGTLGYNWQAGGWVFGLEGDLSWSNIKGTTFTACPLGCETANRWLGTARGRIGYSIDRFLPYLTGGLAVGDIRASRPGFAGKNDTNAGFTVGGGLEVAIAGNWTAKGEYLYVNLGDFTCGISCSALTTDKVSFSTHIVRGGINYRF